MTVVFCDNKASTMTMEAYQAYEEAVQQFLIQNNIKTTGIKTYIPELIVGDTWRERLRHWLKKISHRLQQPEPVDCEPSFSAYACDVCHRPQAGDRYPMKAAMQNDEQFEFDACPDCLYYLTYGRLDDMTMMELELNERMDIS